MTTKYFYKKTIRDMKSNLPHELQQTLQLQMQDFRQQLEGTLRQQTHFFSEQFQNLMKLTDQQLKQISGNVDRKVGEGLNKTSAIVSDVIKRLAEIDTAQKRIKELSTDIIGLKDILNDKSARGAFGEVQLHHLIKNLIPSTHYELQSELPNKKRVDCLLLLPEPTGKLAIDAKFPLNNFKNYQNNEDQSLKFKQLFIADIKKHIKDIQSKYITPPYTSDSAIMFIPAESIFATIHSEFPELVEYSQKCRVWIASPSTLMAILTTAHAVIKDFSTRKQIHVIQQHLQLLATDFQRFQKRMDDLSRHFNLAYQDIDLVHKSSSKITKHFEKIEKVDLSVNEEEKIN
tara:strand:+ start:27 stop:1061 length:1035 start_codon:yes stop_codon:yes gene_type:complete